MARVYAHECWQCCDNRDAVRAAKRLTNNLGGQMTHEEKLLTENYVYSLELARRADVLRGAISSSVARMSCLLDAVDKFVDAQDRWSGERIASVRNLSEQDNGDKKES